MKRLVACVLAAGATSSCVHRQVVSKQPAPATATVWETQVARAADAGEGDFVVKRLRRQMAAEPENAGVRVELIRRLSATGHPDLALEHSRLAAERFRDSAEVHLLLARALRDVRLHNDAANLLDRFLSAHPQVGAEYYSWLGIMRDELKQWAPGEQAHRAALERDSRSDYLYNNLGYNLLMQERKAEAAEQFRLALKIRPASEVARNNLGLALAGNPNEAIVHWQSIAGPATAHSNMAALLIEQGRFEDARKEIDLALGYNKRHPAALRNLRVVSQLDGKPAVLPIKPVQSRWGKIRAAIVKAVKG
ncbi:MAG: hypothetical protein ACRD8O_01110 [Bryobacteraceae bacterium]